MSVKNNMNNAKIDYRFYCKKFFREFEVSKHSKFGDCWMTVNGYVFDLSELAKTAHNINDYSLALMQLIRFSGIDITKLAETYQLTWHCLEMFYLESQTDYGKRNRLYWWNDPFYIIGGITARERQVCILIGNKGITGSRYQLTVCEEDTIYSIQKKFFETFSEEFKCNSTWRKNDNLTDSSGFLYLHKTLTENGLTFDENNNNNITRLWIFCGK